MSNSSNQPQPQQDTKKQQNITSMRGSYGRSILSKLAEPMTDDEIEWKVQTVTKGSNGLKALLVPYVQARAIQNRLDDVCGLDWSDSYREINLNGKAGIECTISIYDQENNRFISRTDAAELTNIEAIKGGYSDALKRCAVKFSIGRFLYDFPQQWVDILQDRPRGKGKYEYINSQYKVSGQQQYVRGFYIRPSVSEVLKKESSSKQPQNNAPQNQQQSRGQTSQNQRQNPAPQNQTNVNSQNGPTEVEYMNAVRNVESVINFLGIPNEIGQLFNSCNLRAHKALTQAPYGDLQKVYQSINPVKILLERGHSLNLPVDQIYAYVSQYCGEPIVDFRQLIGRIATSDVQTILTNIQKDLQNPNGNRRLA